MGTDFFPELKWSELEFGNSSPSCAQVKSEWALLLLSLCGFMLGTKTIESAHNSAVWSSLDSFAVLALKCSFAVYRHVPYFKNFCSQGNTGRLRRNANRVRTEVV